MLTLSLTAGLDDLCVRFIINLPQEELESVERICFQVEEAQWFYEDFIRPLDPELPSLNLRNFCLLIFQHCPMLSDFSKQHHTLAFEEFLAYKTRVPVRGAILLNQNMDEVVLVKGWKKGANWSFPRGKINKDEPDLDCAVREVYEETGYDLKAAGLVPEHGKTKYIEVTMREQHMRLYVFRGVPMDTHFEPRTRKEISKISWYKISEFPTYGAKKHRGDDLTAQANKFYMVFPFLTPLKKWIGQQRKLDRTKQPSQPAVAVDAGVESAVEESQVKKTNGLISKDNDDMARLLNGLRHSSQPRPSDLPEVAGGVLPPTNEASRAPPKSADLLALLRVGKPDQKPQTPAAQIIAQPQMPPSPSHHHPSHRMHTLLGPPVYPFPTDSGQQMAPMQGQNAGVVTPSLEPVPQLPQIRPIPAPRQPAQLAPRLSGPMPGNLPDRQVPAPYQRTGHPQVAHKLFPTSENQSSAIPAASKLPPPKLTAQSSALLNIFKGGQPAKTSVPNGVDPKQSAPPSIQKLESTPKPANPFVPSQVLTTSTTMTANIQSKTQAGHQAKLLNLFKNPSTAKTIQSKSLQLPEGPVELSAMPSPGHSREHSQQAEPAHEKVDGRKVANGSITIPKHTKANGPISATVNGPLNFPQFQLAKTSRENSHSGQHNGTDHSSVTILARPTSSQGQPSTAALGPIFSKEAQQAPSPKPVAPTLITSSKHSQRPPSPSLQSQDHEPKPFHPQILRRPGNNSDLDASSPNHPLPLPKHTTIPQPSQPTDHKKSLLSLFTKPSPSISPTTTAPHNSIDPSSLISPLSPNPASRLPFLATDPLGSTTAATVSPPKPQTQRRQENTVFHAPDRPPPSVINSMKSTADTGPITADTAKGDSGNEGKAPRKESSTTPVQKEFLLGFLAKVASGGQ